MRNSRICRDNNARYSNLMCEKAHRAARTLSLNINGIKGAQLQCIKYIFCKKVIQLPSIKDECPASILHRKY